MWVIHLTYSSAEVGLGKRAAENVITAMLHYYATDLQLKETIMKIIANEV